MTNEPDKALDALERLDKYVGYRSRANDVKIVRDEITSLRAERDRLTAELKAAREALSNAKGCLDIPLARRHLQGLPIYQETIRSIRAARTLEKKL